MEQLHEVFLLLGSNIKPRFNYLERAKELILENIGEIVNVSLIYETDPIGFDSETKFYNQVILVKTSYKAADVLRNILEIEKQLGRVRSYNGYESRTIDIDILYYDDIVAVTDDLVIPHPRLHKRRFTLAPLCDIAPDFVHPELKKTNIKLLANCTDNSTLMLANFNNDE